MKILIFYTYNRGLLSKFFQEISLKLNSDGHEVHNFYLKNKREKFFKGGVQICGEKRKGPLDNAIAVYKIIKLVKPDVVVSNFSYINPAVLFGKMLGVKRNIAWFHTAYGYTKPSFLKVLNKSFYLNLADVVIANSPHLQRELTSIYKVQPHNTTCVPFWTNIQKLSKANIKILDDVESEVFKIGCVGRLEFEKNHQSVIEVLTNLKVSSTKKIELFIAGEGSYKSDLEELVKSLNLTNDVTFLGNLSAEEMITFYQTMNIIILPSYHEAFGLVFIEAAALGASILVSSKFGSLNFIDPSVYKLEDFTFNPESKSELENKLFRFIKGSSYDSIFFKTLYENTYRKDIIYKKIEHIFCESNF